MDHLLPSSSSSSCSSAVPRRFTSDRIVFQVQGWFAYVCRHPNRQVATAAVCWNIILWCALGTMAPSALAHLYRTTENWSTGGVTGGVAKKMVVERGLGKKKTAERFPLHPPLGAIGIPPTAQDCGRFVTSPSSGALWCGVLGARGISSKAGGGGRCLTSPSSASGPLASAPLRRNRMFMRCYNFMRLYAYIHIQRHMYMCMYHVVICVCIYPCSYVYMYL